MKRFTILVIWILIDSKAWALSGALILGPAGLGGGGTNPIGIPPGATDLDLAIETSTGMVYSLAVSPGLFVGKRHYEGAFFGGYGAGMVIDLNGVGLGGYTSLGFARRLFSTWDFLMEFKQALGFYDGILLPYALRMGVRYEF